MIIRFEAQSEAIASGIKHFCKDKLPEFLKSYGNPYIKKCLGKSPERKVHHSSLNATLLIGDIKHELLEAGLLKNVDVKMRYNYTDQDEHGLCVYYFTRSGAIVVQ